MKSLLAVVLAATAPTTLPPSVAEMIARDRAPVACSTSDYGLSGMLVCVDRYGNLSWVA